MRFAMIGLGRMGGAIARNALDHEHDVLGWDRDPDMIAAFTEAGGTGASGLSELVAMLEAPRVVWVMLPAGEPSITVIDQLAELLDEGDIIINGANEHYERSKQLADRSAKRGVNLLDAGISGGVRGARTGACAMVGGPAEAYEHVEALFADLCVEHGYGRVGESGAGHYAKMIHNAIEYAMMESIGEGFDLLDASEFEFDEGQLARIWANGSVIRSWLLDLLVEALDAQDLSAFPDEIGQSGEGLWSVHEALDRKIATPAIQASVNRRFLSKNDHAVGNRVIQALRQGFGGHDAKDRI